MGTFLFDKTIFGPIGSRRFGASLGINLLPNDFKLCNLDCVYCECGWTLIPNKKVTLPSVEEIREEFIPHLNEIKSKGINVDTFTFAGNGEPTVHPDFSEIIDITIELRDKYYPNAKISVLSNGLLFFKKEIREALMKVDLPVMKIDAGTNETYQIIDRPKSGKRLEHVINSYKELHGKLIIQTMFVKGEHNGVKFDNTTDEEVRAWIELLKEVNPTDVMIYSLERDTAEEKLVKIDKVKLEEIAKLVNNEGLKASVY